MNWDVIKAKAFEVIKVLFSLPMLVAIVVIAMFLYILMMSRPLDANPQGIASVDFARGMITLLFAVGTIAVALILTLAAAFVSGDKDIVKERLDRGKEILSLLIGVFGTIVGFYFGSPSRSANPPPTPATQQVSPAPPAATTSAGTTAPGTTAPNMKEEGKK